MMVTFPRGFDVMLPKRNVRHRFFIVVIFSLLLLFGCTSSGATSLPDELEGETKSDDEVIEFVVAARTIDNPAINQADPSIEGTIQYYLDLIKASNEPEQKASIIPTDVAFAWLAWTMLV